MHRLFYVWNLDKRLSVVSAGTKPEKEVNPNAVAVMLEKGIDISSHIPKNVNRYISEEFDYVVTVCDNAKENCPVFSGKVKQRFHFPFEDPAEARGGHDEILKKYREIRDLIFEKFEKFYFEKIRPVFL